MNRRLVILDKNFVQSESRSTPRLRALALAGCEFALTDTLVYELCSDNRLPELWKSVQKKLFPFANRLHVWWHSADLLRREVSQNGPVSGPEDAEATLALRASLHSDAPYVPSSLIEIVASARHQREVDTVAAVAPMAQKIGQMLDDRRTQLAGKNDTNHDPGKWVQTAFNDDNLFRSVLRACYGNPDAPEYYIPDAEHRITPEWFAFHNARVTLALIGIFFMKYGLSETPGRKFPNTILDTDYLVFLPYADALASDETSGDMAQMREWLYGSTKKWISSQKLLSAIPDEDQVRQNAYRRWCKSRHTHGHDIADWLDAESEEYEVVWESL